MSQSSGSTDRRALCLQLTLGVMSGTGQVFKVEDVVQYASVLEEYLEKGKPSGLKVAGSGE